MSDSNNIVNDHNDLIRQAIGFLERGEALPPEWITFLFPPEHQEPSLFYVGKRRKEEVIASTMSVPFQEVRLFGPSSNGDWVNMLLWGDNVQVLKKLYEKKLAGELTNADGTPGVRLIYIDPPFSTQSDFITSDGEKAYRDKLEGARFIEFIRERLILAREVLAENGSIYVHLDYRNGHYIKTILDEIFVENRFINQIIWKRTSAHSDSKTLGNAHDMILHYSKSPIFLYNKQHSQYSEDYIRTHYRHSDERGRFKDGDLSAKGLRGGGYEYEWKGVKGLWRCPIETMQKYEEEGLIYYSSNGRPRRIQFLQEDGGVALHDIWDDINAVNSQADERIDYPTQKPEALLERIIRLSTNPCDIVLDFFAGSGTALCVAEKLGRRWIGVDMGKLAIYTIQKRLLNLRANVGNKGDRVKTQPFVLYNAGKYRFEDLIKLDWKQWRFFGLQLFNCVDSPHQLAGVDLDGYYRRGHVLVYDHIANKGGMITEEQTIASLHSRLKNSYRGNFYIIAPRGMFAFQQDYVEIGEVKYYALRIPYSFIRGLHDRGFTAMLQPTSKQGINTQIMDAVGFDFMQPLQVNYNFAVQERKGEFLKDVVLTINSITCREAPMDLSMVLIDENYDGNTFDFDYVLFASDFQQGKATLKIQPQPGQQMMLVFIDTKGNESAQVVKYKE